MRNYSPKRPFNTAFQLLKPEYSNDYGVEEKTFIEHSVFFGTFRKFGGTESVVNGVLTIYDTAKIETWFNPDITSDCQIKECETGKLYQIIGTPEDLNNQHQYMLFKVESVGGKA